MNRIIRDRFLTAREAARVQEIRALLAEELPHLVDRHHARTTPMPEPLSPAELKKLRDAIENDGVIPSLVLRLIACAEAGVPGMAQLQLQVKQPWEQAIADIDQALEMVDELPERAGDEGFDPSETLEGIRQTIERSQRVTPGQRQAIDNITDGIQKWLD